MNNAENKLTLIFLGRAGSGKGTQADILKKKYGFRVIETGELVRSFYKRPGRFAGKVKEWSKAGNLVPWWLALHLWIEHLIELPEDANLIFDGAPRDLDQVRVFDDILKWFGRQDAVVLHLKISAEEAKRRLLLRGRVDDTEEGITKRLAVYENLVLPVVRYYQSKNQLIEINGEQSVEEVSREIERKLSERLGEKWPPGEYGPRNT